jgi:hypothetical protein
MPFARAILLPIFESRQGHKENESPGKSSAEEEEPELADLRRLKPAAIKRKKGGPMGSPFLVRGTHPTFIFGATRRVAPTFGVGGWSMGKGAGASDTGVSPVKAPGPLPHKTPYSLFTPRRPWVGRPARRPGRPGAPGWVPALRPAPPFPWRWRRTSALPKTTG